MSIQRIEVVSVPVSDQGKARDFYAEKLGFTVEIDAPFAENMKWVQLAPPGGGVSITLVHWLDSYPAGALKDLYLQCDDIEGTYRDLADTGVEFSDQPFDSPFGKFAHFQDLDGNGWVLHQPAS